MHMDYKMDILLVVIANYNDICVFGKTPEQNHDHLIQLMQTATRNCIVINSKKCNICKAEIKCCSVVCTKDSMKPEAVKVQPFSSYLYLKMKLNSSHFED